MSNEIEKNELLNEDIQSVGSAEISEQNAENSTLSVENSEINSENVDVKHENVHSVEAHKHLHHEHKHEVDESIGEDGEKYLLRVVGVKEWFPIKTSIIKSKNVYLKAVDGVSFNLKQGKTIGIVGESGCGKTTLGRTILRLYEPTAGQIIFDGKHIEKLKGEALRKMRPHFQMIFQDPYSSLSPRLTVGEIVGEAVRTHGIVSKADYKDYIVDIMQKCGLQPHYFERYPHEFSGGQRQRICIAKALALKPKLVICDEPVSALDVSIQAQVINLFKDLQDSENLAYIFISHDLSVVEHISDQVGVMYLGNMVEFGDKKDLFSNPMHPYTRALFSAVPIPDPDTKIKRIILQGDIPSPAHPPKGCKFHTRCSQCMDICREVEPKFINYGNGHCVACHLYSQDGIAEAEDEQVNIITQIEDYVAEEAKAQSNTENEQPVDEQIIDEQIIDEQIIDEQIIDEQIIDDAANEEKAVAQEPVEEQPVGETVEEEVAEQSDEASIEEKPEEDELAEEQEEPEQKPEDEQPAEELVKDEQIEEEQSVSEPAHEVTEESEPQDEIAESEEDDAVAEELSQTEQSEPEAEEIADEDELTSDVAEAIIYDSFVEEEIIEDEAAEDEIIDEVEIVDDEMVEDDELAEEEVTPEEDESDGDKPEEGKAKASKPKKSTKKTTTADKVLVEGDPDAPHGKFVIKKTSKGNFVYKLYAANRRVLAVPGGAYRSLTACNGGIQSVINNAATAPIEDTTLKKYEEQKCPKWVIYQDNAGEFRLRLIASNGNVVAVTNDGYLSKASAKNGIGAIARAAKGCAIVRNDDLW